MVDLALCIAKHFLTWHYEPQLKKDVSANSPDDSNVIRVAWSENSTPENWSCAVVTSFSPTIYN